MSEDLESRILVISASLEQARTAVKLIKTLVDDTSDLPTSNSIPWTIKNKYYSADVHFHLIEYAHWDPLSTRRVPAVIFVWARGQPYSEHVFALHNGLSRFEPEVSLAIALGHEPPHHDDPPEGPDSFLADHGFEYIDGERTRYPEKTAPASEDNGEDNADEDDVQGLSRVVDALSTIMWPTMVRKQASNITSGKRASELRPSLFDFDDDGDGMLLAAAADDDNEEATLAALMEADAVDQGAPQTRASRMRREMQALERWLVENEELHEKEFGGGDGIDNDDDGDEDEDEGHDGDRERERDDSDRDGAPPSVQVSGSASASVHATPVGDPWAASASTTSNPTSTSTRTQTQSAPLVSHSSSITVRPSGFDDDFSAFVSAPAVSIAGGDTAETAKTTPASTTAPTSEPNADARRLYTQTQVLLPSHTGGSILSIRSSDLSISDTWDDLGVGGYEALDDLSNDSLNFSPEHGDVDFDDGDPRPSTSGQRSGDRTAGLGDVPFNLPDILNALQTVREDVAGIEDEAERRARTARFASEFVYNRMGVDDGDGEGKETEV